LDVVCQLAGLSATGARLLHQRANAVYHLPHDGVLVRLRQTRGSTEWEHRLASATRVTRWLAQRGYPTVTPLRLDPVHVDGWTATFWTYVPIAPKAPAPGPADLAHLIRRLHEEPNPPVMLAQTNPLGSLRKDLEEVEHGLAEEQHEWLDAHAAEIAQTYLTADIPLGTGLIHGDAHTGNLFPTGHGYLVGDWDSVSIGPRAQDLIPTLDGVQHFDCPSSDWSDFCSAYGVDPSIAEDPGMQLLSRARELRSLAAYIRSAERPDIRAELDKRLRTLMFNETAIWRAL
jgi:hypothetical protein